ncbi:transporter substrate-binding domain-containing protein [Crenobacter sp. SG2303]|uniref:Transporter substrate-binding domain-containing protein n=1 Tax=Crenobacter oryzisoli TaxID=3056844 RepID=A0ABT7XJS9_9NEIS|nr:transporter substrate-binding domain-containing protein [Crenobacter sp. SG2303]MDN0074037.1 transporter substrate-binding domain-containing protein [Crenobacter sp. SG2303]
MLENRMIRVMVPYSRSLYFNDKGHERGITADLVRDFERHLNRKYAAKLGKRPITVIIIPTTRDKLLPGVANGLADIATGNLTVTPERQKLVDFAVPPYQRLMSELVITGPASPTLARVEDLSGKMVAVRRSSSYYESLVALNQRLAKAGKPPVKLQLVSDALEDEDMMEMLAAGLLPVIVVDDWKAKMWAQVLPNIRVNPALAVHSGGLRGWGVRKGSPKLQAELDDFYRHFSTKEQGLFAYRIARYMKRIKQIHNNTEGDELKRFEATVTLFRKYGQQYTFDPLMLAAQGFQESQLDQNAKSRAGAIGVMQLMPKTGKELQVGDIHLIEPNIHAGAKYMDHLMSRFFSDAKFDESNRTLFAFASYNAGPGNIAKMRKLAEARGLDPNLWFNNVEVVTAEKIGMETTTYVRNIFKYYVAYKLQLNIQQTQAQARAKLAAPAAVTPPPVKK